MFSSAAKVAISPYSTMSRRRQTDESYGTGKLVRTSCGPSGRPGAPRVDVGIGEVGAGDLGQNARLAVIDHVLARRRPQVVQVIGDDPLLAGGDERRRHRPADPGLPFQQERMDVRVVRVLVRRHEHPCAAGTHLVHVVGDLRLVLAVDVDGKPGLLLREHEPVAVVVVAGIALVQVRIDPVEPRALGGVPMIDDQDLAVRVLRRHQQHDGVVENLANLRGLLGCEPMGDVDDGLSRADLGRVDARVEKVERDTFPRQRLRPPLGESARIGQPVVDLDQPLEAIEVLPGTELHQHVRIAVGRRPAVLVLDPVRTIRQKLQVLEHARIPRELAIGANLEAEVLRRRRYGLRAGRAGKNEEKRDDREQADGHLALSCCGIPSTDEQAGYHAGSRRPCRGAGRLAMAGAGQGRREVPPRTGRRPIP